MSKCDLIYIAPPCHFVFLVLPSPSSPSAHDVFSSPVTPSSGARRNLMVNFGSSSPAQTAQPVTLSPTTRQTTARNAPTCKLNFQISRISVNASCTTLKENYHTEFFVTFWWPELYIQTRELFAAFSCYSPAFRFLMQTLWFLFQLSLPQLLEIVVVF